jgi:ATP-dependent RNA helicase DHX29
LRKASGRGKNRKAGGLVTLKLPDQNEAFESAEVSDPYTRIMIQWLRKR